MGDRADHDAPEYMRRIRSFVLREGRMTPAQERAFETHWTRFASTTPAPHRTSIRALAATRLACWRSVSATVKPWPGPASTT